MARDPFDVPNFDRHLDPDWNEPYVPRTPRYTFCRDCKDTASGHRAWCPHCSSTNVEHAGGTPYRRRPA